ncbi:MAG: hypothetical protein ACP5EP_05710 [Acidobacteriaceae bacterium]
MPKTDNLISLKDDMIAFIEGHGLRRFPAAVPEDVPRIWWDGPANPDGWKDFVEMAKAANAPLILMEEDTLDKLELESMLDELQEMADQEEPLLEGLDGSGIMADMEQVQHLLQHDGKIGHIELAFAHQGLLFAHETSTEWYQEYRSMVQTIDALQDTLLDMEEEDDEE